MNVNELIIAFALGGFFGSQAGPLINMALNARRGLRPDRLTLTVHAVLFALSVAAIVVNGR